jgi:hypothetical protein
MGIHEAYAVVAPTLKVALTGWLAVAENEGDLAVSKDPEANSFR